MLLIAVNKPITVWLKHRASLQPVFDRLGQRAGCIKKQVKKSLNYDRCTQ